MYLCYFLVANEQYINDIEERCMNAENELFKLRKEMESVMQEALKVPEGFQRLSKLETCMFSKTPHPLLLAYNSYTCFALCILMVLFSVVMKVMSLS